METAAGHKANVEVVEDVEAVADRMVSVFVSEYGDAVARQGVFRVAISGGNSPKRFFELLGDSAEVGGVDWRKVHVFWVDERYVEPDSPRSNYKQARDTFLDKIAIPAENVHRVPTEYHDFADAKKQYEQTMREVLGVKGDELPQFDLIVLGLGSDGHTGSLFADSYALFDTKDLACVVYVMDEKLDRITLTHPVMRAAHRLVVLVSGADKADILKTVLTSEPDEVRYPIHSLWPALDRITWLVDRQAAQHL